MDVRTSFQPLRTQYPGLMVRWRDAVSAKLQRRGANFPIRLQLPEKLARYLEKRFVFMTKDGLLTDELGNAISRP